MRRGTSLGKLLGTVTRHPALTELVVNGERLGTFDRAEFQRITGLAALEPGRYWLDLSTGNMGFEGEHYPRFNVFHAQCSGGSVAPARGPVTPAPLRVVTAP